MNQIVQQTLDKIDKNRKNINKKFHVEISNEISEIPYDRNLPTFKKRPKKDLLIKFIKKRKYQLQFILSLLVAIAFLILLFWKLYQNNIQEKIAKELLNNYQLTTLYSNFQQYEANKTNNSITIENPFVIGMIKIDKLQLSYPILSETTDELLKISLCKFSGPLPNEIGNLCIAGHNYIDNRFFSRIDELTVGDLIEIYGLSGKKQEYHVTKKYEVEANDLSCTEQNVGNKKIVTLLTCDDFNKNKRLVVQAQ